jgi:hypothetical protein
VSVPGAGTDWVCAECGLNNKGSTARRCAQSSCDAPKPGIAMPSGIVVRMRDPRLPPLEAGGMFIPAPPYVPSPESWSGSDVAPVRATSRIRRPTAVVAEAEEAEDDDEEYAEPSRSKSRSKKGRVSMNEESESTRKAAQKMTREDRLQAREANPPRKGGREGRKVKRSDMDGEEETDEEAEVGGGGRRGDWSGTFAGDGGPSKSRPKKAPPVALTESEMEAARTARLDKLLNDTSNIMESMQAAITRQQAEMAATEARAAVRVKEQAAAKAAAGGGPVSSLLVLSPRRRPSNAGLGGEEDGQDDEEGVPLDAGPIGQPSLVHGARMRDYQVRGLQWLVSLHAAKLNGILADEMGLGKTLQVLSFIAHQAEVARSYGPYLVVVPLSVLRNWKNDALKFCPELASRMHVHYGTWEERSSALPNFLNQCKNWKTEAARRAAGYKPTLPPPPAAPRMAGKSSAQVAFGEEGDGGDGEVGLIESALEPISVDPRLGSTCVILTTYELAIRDISLFKAQARVRCARVRPV